MQTNSTQALGPFERFAIWVQGCERRCNGCISPDSRPPDGGWLIDCIDLAKQITMANIEGITISGGEPFLQATALANVIEMVKKEKDIGVIIYTGFLYSELIVAQRQDWANLLSMTDALIDAPYIQNQNDGLSFRGSSNQTLHLLTKRYEMYKTLYGMKGRKIEVFEKQGRFGFYGIPPANISEIIKLKGCE